MGLVQRSDGGGLRMPGLVFPGSHGRIVGRDLDDYVSVLCLPTYDDRGDVKGSN